MHPPIPEKIQFALDRQLRPGERAELVLKTAWKPSATIPIIWLAVTDRRCLLFSTLRRSHALDEVSYDNINAVTRDRTALRVLKKSGNNDWFLPIDSNFQPLMDSAISQINSRRGPKSA